MQVAPQCAYRGCMAVLNPSDSWTDEQGRVYCSEFCKEDEHVRDADEREEP